MIGPNPGSRRTLSAPAVGRDASRPYGAAELRALAPRYMSRALLTATVLHVVAFGIAAAVRGRVPETPPVRSGVITTVPPPIVREKPSRSAPSRGGLRARQEATAIPTPVPEAEADPARTLADNDRLHLQLGDDSTGTAGEGPTQGTVIALIEPVPVQRPRADTARTVVPLSERVPEAYDFVEVMPRLLDAPVPLYPVFARQAGIEGRVILRVKIGRDGQTRDVQVVRSDNVVFDDAARAAVARWRFTPGLQAGAPVEVWMTIPVRFRLRERT